MSFDMQLNAAFNVSGTIYNATLQVVPDPSAANPVLFAVTAKDAATDTSDPATPATPATLLTVAVAGPDMIYVEVAPPTDVIESVANSSDFKVAALNVVVKEGDFDPASGTFKVAASPSPAPATPAQPS